MADSDIIVSLHLVIPFISMVQKDYLSISNQVYYWRLLMNVQNITTKYKRNYTLMQTNLQATKLLKHKCTDTKLLKMPSTLKLGLN